MKNNTVFSKLYLFIQCFAIVFACFHLYTALFGPFQNIIQRSIHVGGGVILFTLLSINEKITNKKHQDKITADIILDILMALFTIFAIFYLIASFNRIINPIFEITKLDIVIALIFTAIILDVTRRLIGWAIPILAALFLIYAFYGRYFPGIWRHNGIGIEYISEILFFSDRGLWGLVTGISSGIIAIFMIFGAVLFTTGGGKAFMDIACWATGSSYGGAAKLSAVASGLFGMISGSAAANVATTGSFTIPLMKRLGYAAEFAGGVESAASSGGQIMPPIMGAAAFIMAETLGISYSKIALAGLIPSCLFYFGIITFIHFEAKRMNYRGIPREEIPHIKEIIYYKNFAPVFIPIFVLIYFFLTGYTSTTCALRALGASIILYIFSDLGNLKKRFFVLLQALANASKEMLGIISLIASAQIILAMIGLTGIGIKFTNIIVSLGQNSIIISGICAMIGTMLLGMGLPTVAAYLVASAVMAPALIKVGVAPIAAHFFIFYYSIFAGITPPVCGTVYIGSAIAGANWLKTASIAMRLSIGAYVIPFMFLFSPALLLVGSAKEIFISIITSILGIFSLSVGGVGYFKRNMTIIPRLLLSIGGISLIKPGLITDLVGFGMIILALSYQFFKKWPCFTTRHTGDK